MASWVQLSVSPVVMGGLFVLCASCTVDTKESAHENDYPGAIVSTHVYDNGDITTVIQGKHDEAPAVQVGWNKNTNVIWYSVLGQPRVPYQNEYSGATQSGMRAAAYLNYRRTLLVQDNPDCEVGFEAQGKCTNTACAQQDECYAKNGCDSSSWLGPSSDPCQFTCNAPSVARIAYCGAGGSGDDGSGAPEL